MLVVEPLNHGFRKMSHGSERLCDEFVLEKLLGNKLLSIQSFERRIMCDSAFGFRILKPRLRWFRTMISLGFRSVGNNINIICCMCEIVLLYYARCSCFSPLLIFAKIITWKYRCVAECAIKFNLKTGDWTRFSTPFYRIFKIVFST